MQSVKKVLQQTITRANGGRANRSIDTILKSSAKEAVAPYVKSGNNIYIQQAAANPTEYVQ